jgi:hypothetical protein
LPGERLEVACGESDRIEPYDCLHVLTNRTVFSEYPWGSASGPGSMSWQLVRVIVLRLSRKSS